MALPSGDSNLTRGADTKNSAYGMPVDDAKTGVHSEGNAQSEGLSYMQKANVSGLTDRPVTEQARFAAGERNESISGGFKLTQ